MKLLYCTRCNHVFSLGRNLRSCECGQVAGMYVDERHAEVNGQGISLAIGNGSLWSALAKLESVESGFRESYINVCRVEYCWVRPHQGPGNPHTFVNGLLGKDPVKMVPDDDDLEASLARRREVLALAELPDELQVEYWRSLAEQLEAANMRLLKKLDEHKIYI